MPFITGFELYAVEFPFRKPFRHAAAERRSSYSLLLRCRIDTGAAGFGECLPREYVTGESRDQAFDLLRHAILPRLVGMRFNALKEVQDFLEHCNGKAPAAWVDPDLPQTAAWAAVDLALLDAFGQALGQSVTLSAGAALPRAFRYSAVLSAASGLKALKTLAKVRLYGFRQAKLKIEKEGLQEMVRLTRRMLGQRCDVRVDANMLWDVSEALAGMHALSRYGIRMYEQPLAAHDTEGMAMLVRETGLGVMADESLHDAASLETLIERKACTAVNVRISKCGGLMAAFNRCRRALESGLTVQVGAQVGETSLLSAAQLILIAAVKTVTYGEGCFGLHLLRKDPFEPLVQFGFRGRPPGLPRGPGLGVRIREDVLARWCVKKQEII